MNVGQIWTVVGIMGVSLIGLVTAMFWLVTIQGSRMSEGFNALRSEMSVRFDHLENRLEKVETIDREVQALTLKVFGDDPPRSP